MKLLGKEFIKVNWMKIFIVSLILLMSVFTIFANVFAANSDYYDLSIVNDGKTQVNEDEKICVKSEIVSQSKGILNYKVSVNNKISNATDSEIAVVFDNSYSMKNNILEVNDANNDYQQTAKQILDGLYLNCAGKAKVSLSNCIQNISAMTTSYSEFGNQIVNSNFTTDEQLSNGLEFAYNTFSGEIDNKYMILFTDATDSIQDKLDILYDNGINVIIITTGFTNNEIGTELEAEYDNVTIYRFKDCTIDEIINKFNQATIKDIVVEDVFSEKIGIYFNTNIETPTKGTIQGENGKYNWTIPMMGAGETATLTYSLELKERVEVYAEDVYKNINTSQTFTVNYSNNGQAISIANAKDYTIIQLAEYYSLEIQAVSEENSEIKIENVKFNVTGKNENGDIVYRDYNLVTDSKGKIYIKNLKTLEKITWLVEPTSYPKGFEATDSREFNTQAGYTQNGFDFSIETEDLQKYAYNEEKTMLVEIPITASKFTLDLNVQDLNNSNLKLGESTFQLIQPKIKNRYEMEVLEETTDANGDIRFYPTILTTAGTYEYILYQTTNANGYDGIGFASVKITFNDNQEITDVTIKYNDKVHEDEEARQIGYVKLIAGNLSQIEETFDFKLKLKDNVTGDALKGAKYNLKLERTADTINYQNLETDENGEINLVLAGSGYLELELTEVQPLENYARDTQTKTFLINRAQDRIQYIAQKNPEDLNVAIVNANGKTDNKVEVNLTSKLSSVRNMIRIKYNDLQEPEVGLAGQSVTLKVYKDDGVTELLNKTANTDENGIVSFIGMANWENGIYVAKINTNISGAYQNPGEMITVFEILDDEIVDFYEAEGSNITKNISAEEITENDIRFNTAYATVGVDLSEESLYSLNLNLKDKNTLANLEGSQYNITIESGDINKTLPGKKTDAEGNIITKIMKSDEVKITVKQISTLPRYRIDSIEQVIEMQLVNGEYVITSIEPSDADIELDGNVLKYNHYNVTKTLTDDTKLSLYINKQTQEGDVVGNIIMKVSSSQIPELAEGKILTTDSNGEGIYDLAAGLRNIKIPGEGDYEILIDEIDINDENPLGIEKPGTKVKLIVTYKEIDEVMQITALQTVYGNRLVKDKSYTSVETYKFFETRVDLNLYTDFDEVGNFSLDLGKVNDENERLIGAVYNVMVIRPDGSTLRRDGLRINDNVEFEGFFVTDGSKIEITEIEAPLGYKVNEYSDILNVIVDETGKVSLQPETPKELVGEPDLKQRLIYNENENEYLDVEGMTKTCTKVNMIDYYVDTVKFGITAVDVTDSNAKVSGAKFRVTTDKNVDLIMTDTASDGHTSKVVGAKYLNKVVTYTIENLKSTLDTYYYKQLEDKIDVQVAFDEQGKVDSTRTIELNEGLVNAKIISVNSTNDITVQIPLQPFEPLKVNILTKDKVAANNIAGVEYQISPYVKIPAVGTSNENGLVTIDVCYAMENRLKEYSISQLNKLDDYEKFYDIRFLVQYDSNGEILRAESKSNVISNINYEQKTINITMEATAKVPFMIENLDYVQYKNNNVKEPLENAQFTIARTDNGQSGALKTNNLGIDSKIIGYFGNGTNQDSTITYKVKQNSVAAGKAIIDDFDIQVEYDGNGNIKNAKLAQPNPWAMVEYINDETARTLENIGYKGLNGIIKITVLNTTEFTVDIVNKNKLNDEQNLYRTVYKVEAKEINPDKVIKINDLISTNLDGEVTASLGRTAQSRVIRYTIKEVETSENFQKLENSIVIDVTFDENCYLKSYNIVEGNKNVEILGTSILNMKVKVLNYQQFSIGVLNVDRADNTKLLVGTKYNIEAKNITTNFVVKSNSIITNETGEGLAYLGNTYATQTVRYTIVEEKPSNDYQTLKQNIVVDVLYDEEGLLQSYNLVEGSNCAEIIQSADLNIKLKIVNNKKFVIDIVDVKRNEEETYLEGAVYKITDSVNNQTVSTIRNDNHQAVATLNNTNYNTTVEYLIESLSPSVGYQFLENPIKIKVKYNAVGTIENAWIEEGTKYAEMQFVKNGLGISLKIKNDLNTIVNISNISYETKEKLTTARYNIIEKEKDSDIELFSTGVFETTAGDATTELRRAVASKTIVYTLKEVKKATGYQSNVQDIIIEADYDENRKMIGTPRIIQGNAYSKITNYSDLSFSVEIENVRIDDFGVSIISSDVYDDSDKIQGAQYTVSVHQLDRYGGLHNADNDEFETTVKDIETDEYGEAETYFGKVIVGGIENEYVSQDRIIKLVQKTTDSNHRIIKYNIFVRVAFNQDGKIIGAELIPYSNYLGGYLADGKWITGVSFTNYNLSLVIKNYESLNVSVKTINEYTNENLASRISLSTAGNNELGYVTLEYRGGGSGIVYREDYTTSVNDEENVSKAYMPTLSNKTQKIYVYEEEAPENYQKIESKLIGSVSLVYDDFGNIVSYFCTKYTTNEAGNKITTNGEGNLDELAVQIISENEVKIIVKYRPAQNVKVNAIDGITGEPLSGIRFEPSSSRIRNLKYITTDENGLAENLFNEAVAAGEQREFEFNVNLDTKADTYINSEKIKFNVAYDNNGKIANVIILEGNATPIYTPGTLDVIIKVNFEPKALFYINKADAYDANQKIGTGVYTYQVEYADGQYDNGDGKVAKQVAFGKIKANETVKYTITEEKASEGYVQMDTPISYTVKYNANGDADQVQILTGENICEYIIRDGYVELKIISIPKVKAEITLKDEFYSDIDIEEVKFTLVSEVLTDSLENSLVTNELGKSESYFGEVHKGQTVRYTFQQVNIPDGYYDSSTEFIFDIKFNNLGNITDLIPISGGSNMIYSYEGRIIKISAINRQKYEKIAIQAWDESYGKPIENLSYNMELQEMDTNDIIYSKDLVTSKNGEVLDITKEYGLFGIQDMKIIKYTIKQVEIPNYYEVGDIEFYAYYTAEGKLSYITTPKGLQNNVNINVADTDLLETFSGQKANMIINVSNTEIKEETVNKVFNIKVVSQEENGTRINGSKFSIGVENDSGEELLGEIECVTSTIGFEKGIIKQKEINAQSEMKISINQNDVAPGYSMGSLLTSGVVEIGSRLIQNSDGSQSLQLELINNSGFDVTINNKTSEITIKVLNIPQGYINIINKVYNEDEFLKGVHFTVTSAIEVVEGQEEPTDLNTTKPTDNIGEVKLDLGIPNAGKTVIYTLTQEELRNYKSVGEIRILVRYNSKGYIKTAEILTDEIYVTLDPIETLQGSVGTRELNLTVQNIKQVGDYTMKIVNHDIDEYTKILAGTIYNVKIESQFGDIDREMQLTTNLEGAIEIDDLKGFGDIKLTLVEIQPAENMEPQTKAMILVFTRDNQTGKMELIKAENLNLDEIDDQNQIITVGSLSQGEIPKPKPIGNYKMNIINYDIDEYSYTLLGTIYSVNVETQYDSELREFTLVTDQYGSISIPNLGGYGEITATIRELQPSNNRKEQLEDKILKFTRDQVTGEMKLVNAINLNLDKIDNENQVIQIGIASEMESGLFNMIIDKVDGKTNQAINEQANFRITRINKADLSEDVKYISTNETGNVKLEEIIMPSIEGTYEYTIKEVTAPKGYNVCEDIKFNIEFKYSDALQKMVIDSIEVLENNEMMNVIKQTDSLIYLIIKNYKENEMSEIKYFVKESADIDNAEATVFGLFSQAKYYVDTHIVELLKVYDMNNELIYSYIKTEDPGENPGGQGGSSSQKIKYFVKVAFEDADTDENVFSIFEDAKAYVDANINAGIKVYDLNGSIIYEPMMNGSIYLASTLYNIGKITEPYVEGTNSEYEPGDQYILGIEPLIGIGNQDYNRGTSIGRFKQNITTNADNIEIYDTKNNLITDEEALVGTGMKLKLSKENQSLEMILIVKVDPDGDGIFGDAECVKISRYNAQTEKEAYFTNEIKLLTLDVDLSGSVLDNDFVKILLAIKNDDCRKMK